MPSRLFPFCTGKYRWHGSAEAYTGREVQDIPGVLAVFAERRKDSFGPYVRLMSVTQITGQHVPEIILLNSHDGSSSYQMLPGYFRAICTNGLVCGQSLGEVRVPHRGNVVDRVIEGAYEVVGVFDRIEEKRDAMQSLVSPG